MPGVDPHLLHILRIEYEEIWGDWLCQGWACVHTKKVLSFPDFFWGYPNPKDLSVIKIGRRANSLRREKNATAIAKRYGECSEVLGFPWGKQQENSTDSKKLRRGGSKILLIRAPYYPKNLSGYFNPKRLF